jgi:murein DD-endopeptidase MepM/ murein hydrolase activator NlpD
MLSTASRARFLVVSIFVATLLALGLLIWKLNAGPGTARDSTLTVSSNEGARDIPAVAQTPSPPVREPSPAASVSTAAAALEATPSPAGQPAAEPSSSPYAEATPGAETTTAQKLIVPVEGIKPEQLADTFTASRSEGRTHDAIDIIAPRGTPVVAVADGLITKLFLSKPGGITVYQLSHDRKMIYYYAHLERYADGLKEGHYARQGEVIGYVGDTGNAGPGNYHLHFSVMLVRDPGRYWEGVNINPYPLLRRDGR